MLSLIGSFDVDSMPSHSKVCKAMQNLCTLCCLIDVLICLWFVNNFFKLIPFFLILYGNIITLFFNTKKSLIGSFDVDSMPSYTKVCKAMQNLLCYLISVDMLTSANYLYSSFLYLLSYWLCWSHFALFQMY